jgi:hypothetical protein
MDEDSDQPKDLFGDPWTPPRDPRGRKRHRPTPQGREIVAQFIATGASEDDIALQLGLSVPTLRKYYFRELANGRSLARNEMLKVLYEKGKAGNTSAAKEWLRQTEKAELVGIAYQPRERRSQPKLGKKEERQQAAEQVGGILAPGAPPAKLAH